MLELEMQSLAGWTSHGTNTVWVEARRVPVPPATVTRFEMRGAKSRIGHKGPFPLPGNGGFAEGQ